MKKAFTYDELLKLNMPSNEVEIFHQKTKLEKVRQMNSKRYPKSWKVLSYKGYPRFKEVTLPRPALNIKRAFISILNNRDSSRVYKPYQLTLPMLSNLSRYSYGLKEQADPLKGRFYPSAGARYPIELYLLSLNTHLERGLYHYYFKNNSYEFLLPMKKINISNYSIPKGFKNASCFIIMTAIFDRAYVKYGVRAYTYTMMEAGHIGQNIHLVSAALGLKCCAIGGFNNYAIDELLDIDGVKETSIYMFAVGK